jgi:hypothetical protein
MALFHLFTCRQVMPCCVKKAAGRKPGFLPQPTSLSCSLTWHTRTALASFSESVFISKDSLPSYC